MNKIKKSEEFMFKNGYAEEAYTNSDYIIAEKIDFATGESEYSIYVGNLDKSNLVSKGMTEDEVERFFLEEAFDNARDELLFDADCNEFGTFTDDADERGEIPASIKDARNILEYKGDICNTDEYGRVFSTNGVYLADMILLK